MEMDPIGLSNASMCMGRTDPPERDYCDGGAERRRSIARKRVRVGMGRDADRSVLRNCHPVSAGPYERPRLPYFRPLTPVVTE